MSYYILDGKTPIKVNSISEWTIYFKNADRRVNFTAISDEVYVSTVFLGIDHSFGGFMPVLFETMIFGGKHNEYQERYCTWEEAEIGHENAVNLCLEENDLILNGRGLVFKL